MRGRETQQNINKYSELSPLYQGAINARDEAIEKHAPEAVIDETQGRVTLLTYSMLRHVEKLRREVVRRQRIAEITWNMGAYNRARNQLRVVEHSKKVIIDSV